ncbi:MAG TPA: DNA-binding protein [Polyangiaceae bacterium]|jgi:hypothetical protein
MTTPKIQSIIENFVSELSVALVEASHAAIADALGAGTSVRAVSAGGSKSSKAPKSARRAKGAKRSPEELTALTQSLLAFVKRHPGQRIEQIAGSIGASTKDLALPAKKLIGEKKLSTKGQKRATTYFPK